jgi:adenosine deaminase
MNFQSLPKIELHLHLDCSLSFKVVQQLDPSVSYEVFRQSFVAPPKCTDLNDYLTRAVKGFELMQTREALRLVTLDLFEQLQQDNVIYAEIRFAPLLHIAKGLKPEEVVACVNDAVGEGIDKTGIQARIILCTLRQYLEEQSMETVKLVEKFKGTFVAGFDMAGDEAGFPVDAHLAAYKYARENNICCTAHAGEAKGANSVWETLQHFHPLRIGHGVRSAENEKLLDFLRDQHIHLEVCPTSNVQTNVVATMQDHPAEKIYKHGVSMSINTDCRTISDVTLSSEFSQMATVFNWQKEHFLRCTLEGIAHAFCEEALKEKLRQQVLAIYSSGSAKN